MILASVSGSQVAEIVIAVIVGVYLVFVLVNAERM